MENKGTIRQIFDGIAVVSGLKCAYGELVQFPKADQLVNIFGLVVSINKYNYSKVILFGSTFLLKVGDQVDNTFNNLKVYIGSHFLGTVLNGIGQYIDIKETKFTKNV
jgi:F0F1-type ATP synthase alpha subunit